MILSKSFLSDGKVLSSDSRDGDAEVDVDVRVHRDEQLLQDRVLGASRRVEGPQPRSHGEFAGFVLGLRGEIALR